MSIAITQPVVDVTLHLDAKVLEFEFSFVKLPFGPGGVEIGMHVEIEVELIGLVLDLEDVFDQGVLILDAEVVDGLLLTLGLLRI